MGSRWLRDAARMLTLAAGYFATGQLGYLFSYGFSEPTLIWPPTGIALAALLLGGRRLWPGIALGALALEAFRGSPMTVGVGMAVGETVGALVAVEILCYGSDRPFRLTRMRSVLMLLVATMIAASASTLIKTTTSGLLQVTNYESSTFLWHWTMGTLGNALGILVVAPVMLSWAEISYRHIRLRNLVEAGLLIILLAVTSRIAFGAPFGSVHLPLSFAPYPVFIWLVMRQGMPAITLGILIVAVFAILGTIQGYGPFVLSNPHQTTIFLMTFAAMSVPTILLLGVSVVERRTEGSARRESEERLELALWGADLGLWDWNVQTRHVYFNRQWAEMLGFEQEELVPEYDTWERLIHTEDLPGAIQMLSDHLKGKTDFFDAELRMQTRGGSWKWIHTRGKVTARDETGTPLRVTGTQWDIDARKSAEEALRDSEERLRSLFDTVPAYVIRLDRDLIIRFINRAMPPLTLEQVVGTPLSTYIPPDSQQRVAVCLKGVLDTGESDHYEIDFHAPDGSVHNFETWVGPVTKDGEVIALTLSSVEVTKRKQTEEKLRNQEQELAHVARLSTMGQMVAGISHEINQPLYAITNFAEACRSTLPSSPEGVEERLSHWINQISQQARRAGEIIHRLRNFSRKAPRDAKVDLNEVIREAVDLSGAEIRSREVRVELLLAECLPQVHADQIQIQQVIVNLLCNACDAMLDEPTEERQVTISTSFVDGAVEVAVQDRGCGLPDTEQGDIFDTFYTTKEEGLGMGLAISQSIIEAHEGRLWASSNADRGTTMRFTIPKAVVAKVA